MAGWIGPAIQAGTSILGGIMGSQSSSRAASAVEKGNNKAASLQYQQYAQARQDLAPYQYIGNQALNAMASTLGFDPYRNQPAVQPTQYNMVNLSNKQQKQMNKALGKLGPAYSGSPSNKKEQKAINKITKQLGYNPFSSGGTVYPGGSQGFNEAQGSQFVGSAGPSSPGGNAYNTGSFQQGVTGGAYTAPNMITGVGAPQSVTINTPPNAPPQGAGNYNAFFASPDYNFRLDEGIKALDRSAASRGMLLSGAQQKAISDYGQNTAASEYNNWYSKLAELSGIGERATQQNVNVGGQYAANAGNAAIGGADARASGYLGQANSWAGAAQGVGNALAGWLGEREGNRVYSRGRAGK